MKKTVIIGATTNPSRYAYLAAEMLTEYKHEIVPVGLNRVWCWVKRFSPFNRIRLLKM
jgi:hypothetical protein